MVAAGGRIRLNRVVKRLLAGKEHDNKRYRAGVLELYLAPVRYAYLGALFSKQANAAMRGYWYANILAVHH